MLIDGSTTGSTPSTVQIRVRHISQMKVKLLSTVLEAEGTSGRIQFGEAPGCSAQVIVPACSVPDTAAGTDPIAPGTVTAPPVVPVDPLLLLLLLLQAASAVMLATARASPPILLLRIFIIGPPSSRCSRFWSVLGSSGCRPSLWFAGDPLRTVAGRWVAGPRYRLRPVSPAHPYRLIASRPVSYRCYELAEA